MTNYTDDSVEAALRRGLGRRRGPQSGEDLPLEGPQILGLAAYLDGTLTAGERARVEEALLQDGGRLELLLASRAALAAGPAGPEPLPSDAVLRRAQALVPEKPRMGGAAKLRAWLLESFSRPLRPALGAAALALYGAFCLQVFDWGLAGGEVLAAATAVEAEAAPAEASFVLALEEML
jgi:hypothetical protein